MEKSADAFRTISEVADWLGVQTHVLRFWESKFSQIKPVKRAGGRRYYRPADMLLIGGIRKLLHDDGLTIKGVQKILREEGIAYVSDISHPLDDETAAVIDGIAQTSSTSDHSSNAHASEPQPDQNLISPVDANASDQSSGVPHTEPIQTVQVTEPSPSLANPPTQAPRASLDPEANGSRQDPMQAEADNAETLQPASDPSDESMQIPQFRHTESVEEELSEKTRTPSSSLEGASALETKAANVGDSSGSPAGVGSEQQPVATLLPTNIDVQDVPEDSSFGAEPSVLTKATATRQISRTQREALRPLLVQLTALRDQMAGTRRDSR